MKVFTWFVTIIMALIFVGLVFVYFSPDYNIHIVLSESMSPAIKMGSMIVTGPIDGPLGQAVRPGVIVTYNNGGELITHRVMSVEEETLVTKGDANEDADPWPVTMSSLTGVYLFKIPYLGYLSSFLRTGLGWFVVIIIPTLILVSFIIKGICVEALKKAE